MKSDARAPFLELLEDLREYLDVQRDLGRSSVSIPPEDIAEISRWMPKAPPAAGEEQPAAEPVRTAQAGHGVTDALSAIAARVALCRQCPLCEARKRTVPGQGNAAPDVAFVGEGPGAEEDRQGQAFVGRAGQLLTRIIEAMGYTREEVWIGNIVKCRPPGNRAPYPDEMESCLPFLKEQLALLQPKVIVCLGATAVKGLLGLQSGISKIRGTWYRFEGIDVMPTFHPAYLLRNEREKRPVWEDMKEVLCRLGREIPPVGKG